MVRVILRVMSVLSILLGGVGWACIQIFIVAPLNVSQGRLPGELVLLLYPKYVSQAVIDGIDNISLPSARVAAAERYLWDLLSSYSSAMLWVVVVSSLTFFFWLVYTRFVSPPRVPVEARAKRVSWLLFAGGGVLVSLGLMAYGCWMTLDVPGPLLLAGGSVVVALVSLGTYGLCSLFFTPSRLHPAVLGGMAVPTGRFLSRLSRRPLTRA